MEAPVHGAAAMLQWQLLIHATGKVSTVGAGTTDIKFTITGGCNGTPFQLQTLTVLPDAAVTSVSGTSPLCIGSTATYAANGEY